MKKILLLVLVAATVLAEDLVKDWTRINGSPARDAAARVCVDQEWNAYVCGVAGDSFGGQTITSPGTSDLCLAKYAPGGTCTWLRLWGSPYGDSASAVARAPDGSIYVAGTTYGQFDGQTNVSLGSPDLCLSKFASDGTRLWSRIWGSDDYDYGSAIAISSDGFVYVAGETYGEFGGQTNASPDFEYEDFCVTKFTPGGSQLWTRIWGSYSEEETHGASVDPSGNILVGGITYRDFAGQVNPSPGEPSLCLTKYSPAGVQLWVRIWGSAWDDSFGSLSVDSAGNIHATGTAGGAIDGVPCPGDYCPCLTKYSAAGAQAWVRIWEPDDGGGYDVCRGSDGTIYVAGTSFRTLLAQGTIYANMALYALDATGGVFWSSIWGSQLADVGAGIAIDSGDGIYVAGWTEGFFDGQQNAGDRDMVLTRFVVPEPAVAAAALALAIAAVVRARGPGFRP